MIFIMLFGAHFARTSPSLRGPIRPPLGHGTVGEVKEGREDISEQGGHHSVPDTQE